MPDAAKSTVLYGAAVLCVILTVGGLLAALAALLVVGWSPHNDLLAERLAVSGFVAFFAGGVPWFLAVA